MSVQQDEVRRIEADAAPTRFARGWHCLGLVRDFADGQPHQVLAFGQKLVVFAGSDGALNVLDAYCRHMGGDLSQGTVKGNEIACPFHDWRWGGDGRCKAIPYARRIEIRICQTIIHRRKTGRCRVPKPGDLHRSRFASERQQPAASAVQRQVYENVD